MNNDRYFEFTNCDYDKYYRVQAGGALDLNELSFYTGKPFQRGYNIFSTFGKRYAIPFLKYFGKKAFNYGKNVLSDILKGEEPKSVLKTNLKRTANETVDDVKALINQKGKRRRRVKRKSSKKTYKRKRKNKKKPKRKSRSKNKKSKRRLRSKFNIFDN